MAMCELPNCQEHYGCRLKAKGLQVGAKLQAARRTTPPKFRNAKADSWAVGQARDDRGVKLVRPNGMPVSTKEASEQRHHIKDQHARADAGRMRAYQPSSPKE